MSHTEPKITKSVEDFLNEISYSDDLNYIPSSFALEFINFIKLVNGADGEENLTPVLHYRILDKLATRESRVANLIHRGGAKALCVDTQIPTPKGNIRLGELSVGDTVFTREGKQTHITHKSAIFNKPMYELCLKDGRKLRVSEDHLNIVLKRRTGAGCVKGFNEHVLSTKELLDKGVTYKRKITKHSPTGEEIKWYMPTAKQVEFTPFDSPIDPYTVGAILGDGSIDKATGFTRFYTHSDDLEFFLDQLENADSSSVRSDKRRESTMRFSLKKLGVKVKEFIGTENVYYKRIPQGLLWGSTVQRIALLQGLLDTDGTVGTSGYGSFCTVSPGLANDVIWLVRSLGGEVKQGNDKGDYYRLSIRTDFCPFRLPRKILKWRSCLKGMVGITHITPIEDTPSQCIAVADPTHSFLAEGFCVTHNTTIIEYLFLYLGVYGAIPGFGKVPLVLYVSDSIENGVKNMRKNLEHRWENSDFLKEYSPKTRFTDVRWEFTNKNGDTFIVKGYGARTGVRGAKEMGTRPTLAVLDDLLSDEDARSPTVISSIEDTVYKAVTYALHPTKNKIIWSGTPFNARDPLYKAVESGAWVVNCYPVCEKFPCTRKEFKGSWPDRFTYDYVMDQYTTANKTGKMDTFNQEMMLRIMSEEDRLILDHEIGWYKRDSVLKNKSAFNFYITTDFAVGDKAANDFSVISVWALNRHGDWFWVDGVVAKQTMDKSIEDLFRLAQRYKPMEVGIEVSGQQAGFMPWIRQEMMTRNNYFNLASEGNSNKPGIRPNTDKSTRFSVVVPWFKLNKMYFPEEMRNSVQIREAMEELTLAAKAGFKSKHDDFIDTISMLPMLNYWKPSADLGMSKSESSDGSHDIWEMDDDEDILNAHDSYIV